MSKERDDGGDYTKWRVKVNQMTREEIIKLVLGGPCKPKEEPVREYIAPHPVDSELTIYYCPINDCLYTWSVLFDSYISQGDDDWDFIRRIQDEWSFVGYL